MAMKRFNYMHMWIFSSRRTFMDLFMFNFEHNRKIHL